METSCATCSTAAQLCASPSKMKQHFEGAPCHCTPRSQIVRNAAWCILFGAIHMLHENMLAVWQMRVHLISCCCGQNPALLRVLWRQETALRHSGIEVALPMQLALRRHGGFFFL